MNKGIRSGLVSDSWRTYRPKIVTVNSTGTGLTQPFLDTSDGRYQFGRYQTVAGLTLVQIQLAFLGSSTVGAGTAYAFSLPLPARRPVPDTAALMPIGQGMCYWSTVEPFVNIPTLCTLADPWFSLAGQHDSYFQMYAPQVTSWGTATISGGGSGAITHRLGFTPAASDITVTGTSYTGTANYSPYWLSAIGATSFVVNTYNNNVGSAATIAWKAICEPPTGQGGNLVGPSVPFDWSRFTSLGPYGNMFVELAYEPA